MTTPRTPLLASLFSLGLILSPASGLVSNASAEPDAPYCPALAATLPGIDGTYTELKKAAEADEDASEDAPAKPKLDTDAGALLQKEVELADRLTSQLNDLAHQTQEDGLKRIAREATDTAATFAASLHEKQNGDAPDTAPSAKSGGGMPDAAPGVDAGMLGGLVHPNQEGNAGDDWSANFNYSSNKLRNEMNALNHLCQANDLSQPPGAVDTGDRRGGH